MMSLSDDNQAGVIGAFNTTFRYLDDILNINNVYFDKMASQIYPSELQLNKANTSDTEAAFLDLNLSISNDIVSTKIYDKRDDFVRVGYNLDIMRQSACLVLNPITVYSYGFLFNCTTVGQASDSMTALT